MYEFINYCLGEIIYLKNAFVSKGYSESEALGLAHYVLIDALKQTLDEVKCDGRES